MDVLNHFCILLFVFLVVKTFKMPTGICDLNICSDEIKIILLWSTELVFLCSISFPSLKATWLTAALKVFYLISSLYFHLLIFSCEVKLWCFKGLFCCGRESAMPHPPRFQITKEPRPFVPVMAYHTRASAPRTPETARVTWATFQSSSGWIFTSIKVSSLKCNSTALYISNIPLLHNSCYCQTLILLIMVHSLHYTQSFFALDDVQIMWPLKNEIKEK